MSNIRSKIDYINNNKQFREIKRQQLLQSRRDLTDLNCFNGIEAEKAELFQIICMIFETIDRFFNSAEFKYGFINYMMLMCNNVDFMTSKSFGPNPNFQILDEIDIILDDINEYQKCLDETIYELPKNSVSIQFIEQYLNHNQYQSTLKNIIEGLTVMLIEIYLIVRNNYNKDLEHLKVLTYQFIKLIN